MSNRLAEVSFTIFFFYGSLVRTPRSCQTTRTRSLWFTLPSRRVKCQRQPRLQSEFTWNKPALIPVCCKLTRFSSLGHQVLFFFYCVFFSRRLYDKTTMLEPATKVDHVSVGVDFGYATEKEKKKDRMHRISRIASIPEIKEKTGLNGQVVSIKQPVEMTATRRDRSAQNKVRFESSLSWCG